MFAWVLVYRAMEPPIQLRRATVDDVPALHKLIDASVRVLQAGDYTREQIEGALGTVFGVDTRLIEDGTYFVAEAGGVLAGCGGWMAQDAVRRRPRRGREDTLSIPRTMRRGSGRSSCIPNGRAAGSAAYSLGTCEQDAARAGFQRFELETPPPRANAFTACGAM